MKLIYKPIYWSYRSTGGLWHWARRRFTLAGLCVVGALAIAVVILNSYITNLNYGCGNVVWPMLPVFVFIQLEFFGHWLLARKGVALWVQYLPYQTGALLIFLLGRRWLLRLGARAQRAHTNHQQPQAPGPVKLHADLIPLHSALFFRRRRPPPGFTRWAQYRTELESPILTDCGPAVWGSRPGHIASGAPGGAGSSGNCLRAASSALGYQASANP